MKTPHYILVALSFVLACSLQAQTVVLQDGFESGALGSEWDITAGTSIQTTGGANGTTNSAALVASTANAGARFDDVAPDGANDFYVDFYFRVKSSTQRQINFQISDSTSAIGSSAATINLRYQTNQWSAYAGTSWRNISGLSNVTAGQWYRFRLTGYKWGKGTPSYDLQLSDADGSSFTSVATNLTWFQNGNPSNNTARFFIFTTGYGSNPGFDVDEVSAVITAMPPIPTNAILNISGTYPHLAVFGADGECGIGAVASWCDKLWFVTYPPHKYQGSPEKLWTVDTNLTLAARPESIGGTHANRFVHRESGQLIMGPYFINSNGTVRTPGASQLPGRFTATARHLTDPTNLVYMLTMEEGLYEVDVNTLAVNMIYRDGNMGGTPLAAFPGAHGKGAYTGQGRLLYSNNGEPNWSINSDFYFNGPAGALVEHTGTNWADAWVAVQRKNTCEVTGPGGIYGAENDSDPIWSTSWDKRSVLLKVLDNGNWTTFRLPKASYTHDAMHGWYTEWPRIREITNGKILMHMHGMFYDFPKTFAANNTANLRPICTYLKMPVDYCWWNGQLVMARDDASTTGGNPWAGQSHSAPWFGQLSDLEQWGKPAGFGGPWKQDTISTGTPSDPFLVAGFARRAMHLMHASAEAITFSVEYKSGSGVWASLTNITVAAHGYGWLLFPTNLQAEWVRLTPDRDASGVTAYFQLANPPASASPALFAGIADAGATNNYSDGIIRPQGGDARTLQFAASVYGAGGSAERTTAYYTIDGTFQLRRTTNATAETTLRSTYSLSNANFSVDAASVIYTEGTNRFRLPKGDSSFDAAFASGWPRGVREVVTERRLFNAHGTFYELPHSDSGGFRRVRPVSTHNKHISDFASWRGLFVVAGVPATATNDGHCFRSEDGQVALWFGNVDDLWQMGAPRGTGGPWRNTTVEAGVASDPYLFLGYESKRLELSHDQPGAVTFTVEVDVTADGDWVPYASFVVPAGQAFTHVFPTGYSAHWVRLKADTACHATAMFTYALESAANRAPTPGTFLLGVPQNGSVTFPADKILQQATDPDGDSITITNFNSTTAHGGNVAFADNAVTYTAPADFLGSDSFSYQLLDSQGNVANGQVTVHVTTNGPSLTLSSCSLMPDQQLQVRFSGESGYSYTVQSATNILGPWFPFTNFLAGTNGVFELNDVVNPIPQRYYRTTHP